jgi:hypothetical protein
MIRLGQLGLSLLLAAGAGCARDQEVPTAGTPAGLAARETSGAELVACPPDTAQTASTLIGPLGGVLAAGNTRVVIPASAVLAPTTFTLTVPASPYVEIDVRADGAEHYLFAAPVTVTIDYARCGRRLDETPLSAWNIDPQTKALLERMTGVDDKLTHTITFTTIHFSGYAVAD